MIALLLTLLLAQPVHASDVDPVALAGALARDGYWDRVVAVLDEAAPPEDEAGRYWALLGLARLRTDDAHGAAEALAHSVEAGAPDVTVHLHLGRALLDDGRASEALLALDAEGTDALLETWRLRALAHRAVGDEAAAYQALQHDGLARDRVLFLLELGLAQQALDEGREALQPEDPESWLHLGEALRRAGELDAATTVFEDARLRFPEHGDLLVAHARVYAERGLWRTAGDLLARSGDASLALQAADCFAKGGDLRRALAMNALVADSEDKALQRLGLLVGLEEWDRVATLQPRLMRLGLADSDEVAYALAYAHAQLGELDQVEPMLRTISDPRWLREAVALREQVATCDERGWACSLSR